MSGDAGGRDVKLATNCQLSFFVNLRIKLLEVLYTICHTQGTW